mmetsp:Transcript_15831/g.36086  ORF Transcript_15831/g.36086 Transcript_15831/m.36086 type:complete len:301 (+) Transcript_15831:39-941(+)
MGEPVKVFVGRLPRDITEDDFSALMGSQLGLVETILLKDKATGRGKGCGFAKFATIDQALGCVEAMNGAVTVSDTLGPLQVSVASGEAAKHGVPQETMATGQAKLFVGGLPKGADLAAVTDELNAVFSGYGEVTEVYVMKDRSGGCKGAAFVKMASTASANAAMQALHEQHTVTNGVSALEVKFAAARVDNVPQAQPPQMFQQPAAKGARGGKGLWPAAHHPMPMQPAPPAPPARGGRAPPPPPPGGLRQVAGWTEFCGDDGRAYYHHQSTGLTQWEQPPEFQGLPQLPSRSMGGRARPY